MAKIISYCTLISLAVFLALGLANPIARVFLILILASVLYSIVATKSYLSQKPIRQMLFFLFFITIYFLFTWGFVGNDFRYGNIVGFYSNIGLALGVFFFGLYCSVNANISKDILKLFFFIFLLSLLFRFIISKDSIQDKLYGNMTLNMGYDFVTLLPYLFLFKKKWIPILVSPIIILVVLACIKRGAIIITVIFFLYYIYEYFIKTEKKHRIRNVLLSLVILTLLAYLAWNYYWLDEQLQRRMQSLMQGDINGRDRIYSLIYENWLSNGLIQFIFGNGFCSSYKIAGNYAHNDWLELLAMSGIIGPIIYLRFFIKEYKFASGILFTNDRLCIIAIIIIWFCKSLFSMSYCSFSTMTLSLIFGYLVGNNLLHKKINYNNYDFIKSR